MRHTSSLHAGAEVTQADPDLTVGQASCSRKLCNLGFARVWRGRVLHQPSLYECDTPLKGEPTATSRCSIDRFRR